MVQTNYGQDVHGVPNMTAVATTFAEISDVRYDWHRRTGPDARDPRCVGPPCGGAHRELHQGANQYGAWYHCSCRLRIVYIPRKGMTGLHREAGPLPADVAGVPMPPTPVVPHVVTGMAQPDPTDVKAKAKPKPKAKACAKPPTSSPTAEATATEPSSTPGASSSGAAPAPSSASSAVPPAAPAAAPVSEDVAGALQQIMAGIAGLNQRLIQTEQSGMAQAAATNEVATRLINLENRTGETEAFLLRGTQVAQPTPAPAVWYIPAADAATEDAVEADHSAIMSEDLEDSPLGPPQDQPQDQPLEL